MKWDIFNGKIKKEYYGYMMFSFIFTSLISLGGSAIGVLIVYGVISGTSTASLISTIIAFVLGVIFIIQSPIFIFLELFAIRNYPKYEKIRKRMFNSDCYFVGCDSFEYRGPTRGRIGRRNKTAFDLITYTTELEKGIKETRFYSKYKKYCLLGITMGLIGFVGMFAIMILGDNKSILPKALQNDNIIIFMAIVIPIVFFALMISLYIRAINVLQEAKFAPIEDRFALCDSLAEIAVRRSNKKHKFGYNVDQIKEIEAIVNNSDASVELKIEEKNGRLACFKLIDSEKKHRFFSGYFIQKR